MTVIQPKPDSRLEQLCGQYDVAKAEAEKAAAALKAITDGIKFELIQAAPGETSMTLVSDLVATPLQLSCSERWTVDTKKLKTEDPETYVRYAKKSTPWTLRAVSA
jgi:hypothetical protein